MTSDTPATPEVRASDTEREDAARAVREAVSDGRLTPVEGQERLDRAYGAVHRRELDAVTADLGSAGPSAPPPVPEPDERPAATTTVALFGGFHRAGGWTPGRRHRSVSLMGGGELDFRRARLGRAGLRVDAASVMGGVEVDLRGVDPGPDGVTIRAGTLMGGVNLVVDEDADVDVRGLGIFGGFDDDDRDAPQRRGPRITVRGAALFGGVHVERRPRDAD